MLEKYPDFLKPSEGDSILVIGENSLFIALYLAGKAREENKKISVHAVVDPHSKISSISNAIDYSRKNLAEYAKTMENGSPLVTFSVKQFLEIDKKFNKAVMIEETYAKIGEKLAKLNQLAFGEKIVLFEFPLKFSGKFILTEKKLFREKQEFLSLRQVLKRFGFEIDFYDVKEKKIMCLSRIKQFNEKMVKTEILFLSSELFGEMISKEILKWVEHTADKSSFALNSEDGEYVYIIKTEDVKNQPIELNFIFLDGRTTYKEKVQQPRSKKFSVIVVPRTDEFIKEIVSKDILIIPRKKINELFGEVVEPY